MYVSSGQGLLIHEVSRSHSDKPQSVELLWTSHQPVAETSTSQQTSMPSAGFEPTIPAGERPQTHALDRAATGTKSSDTIQVYDGSRGVAREQYGRWSHDGKSVIQSVTGGMDQTSGECSLC